MKTSWRSASLVATAAAVLALTTACGQESGTQSTGSQNVGAAAAANGYGQATSSSTTSPNGYGADQQSAAPRRNPQVSWPSRRARRSARC